MGTDSSVETRLSFCMGKLLQQHHCFQSSVIWCRQISWVSALYVQHAKLFARWLLCPLLALSADDFVALCGCRDS